MRLMHFLGGRKSAPAASRPQISSSPALLNYLFAGGDEDAGVNRHYPAMLRASYERNAIAQRAVRIVSEGVASAPLSANMDGLVKLVKAASAGQSLLETLAAQLLLHGNGFVRILANADGYPAELIALRPEHVTVLTGEDGWPAVYAYRVGENTEHFDAMPADGCPQIIHIKSFNPADDVYGLGCLGAAAEAVCLHNKAAQWNRALLANGARPSGALIYENADGANLSEEQFQTLKKELEAHYSGAQNNGRPLLLEGGLKWQSMSLSPAEMDFAKLKEAASREIALAFGVPPMLLGLPGDNSYANYREANRALWRLTLLPLTDKILGALGQGLSAYWPDARISVDLDHLPALSEDRERLWAQVSAADFLTREEKRAFLGLEQNI